MDYVLNLGSTIYCTGMGTVKPQIANPRVVPTRVKVVGKPILTKVDLFPVIGCNNGTAPPCTLMSEWPKTMLRVSSGGVKVLHETSKGLCPTTGHTTTTILNNQFRVKGT
jgi:hypothetical protein